MTDPEIEKIRAHAKQQTDEHEEFSRFWNESCNERQLSRRQISNPNLLNAAETLAWVVYLKVKRGQK